MAKLGDFEFPEVGLQDSIELARRIHHELGGEVRRNGLAMILDMSPIGGAYGARIGALRMWGLATGRSVIRLTRDAERLVSSPNPIEESALTRKLARSVPLFNELNDRIGDTSLDQRVLSVMMQEITGAEIEDVARRVAMVERIYGGIQGVFDANFDEEWISKDHNLATSETNQDMTLPKGWIEFKYDDGTLRLRESSENLDVLIGVLKARKDQIKGH